MHRLENISCRVQVALAGPKCPKATHGYMHAACKACAPFAALTRRSVSQARCSQVNRQLAAVNAAITAAARSRRWQQGLDLARQILLGPEVALEPSSCSADVVRF